MQQLHAELLAATFPINIFIYTNLNSNIQSHEFFPINYSVYRCDRSKNISIKTSHGGVLIAVDKQIKSEMVIHGDEHGCEQLWVELSFDNREIYLGALYVSPNSNASLYDTNMNLTQKVCNSVSAQDSIFLCGDFNLTHLQWKKVDTSNFTENFNISLMVLSENQVHPLNVTSEIGDNVVSTCQDIGLFQINYHLNYNGRILDLIWSNDPDFFTCNVCINHLLRNEIYHKALTFDYLCDRTNTISSTDEFYRDFRNADYDSINTELASIDWNKLLNTGHSIHKYVPLKKTTIASRMVRQNCNLVEK